jgi:N-methylhydantoinase B
MNKTMSQTSAAMSPIALQILWNRLIGVVEEQAQTMIRIAFSNTVREAGDLAAGVFGRNGDMLAQAVTGTPGHVNSMANGVRHFLTKYPLDAMREGDHYITNDPWLTAGHLHDITVVTPAFHRGRAVALFACTSHVVDIGGRGFGPDGRHVFEEGLYIPIMRLAEGGRMSEPLLELIRANVREPLQVEGDIHAFAACNEEGCRRLSLFMDEFALASLDVVGTYILEASRAATLKEIASLPAGVFTHHMQIDGYDRPIDLVASLSIGRDGMAVDFAGTSPASRYGINVVLNYTTAYTVFGLKCIVAPKIPNNAGSLAPFRVTAPLGSILNVERYFPVAARHVVGHMLPDLVLGCLNQAIPNRVPAEGASANWQSQLRGGPGAIDPDTPITAGATDFNVITFNAGGTGARPGKDGLSATAFPSGVRSMPVETTEQIAPVLFWRKEYRPDSGGPGVWRGGLGQIMEIGAAEDEPFAILAMFERVDHPARGRDGGGAGAAGWVGCASGARLRGMGHQTIPVGDRLRLLMPGGGGLGAAFGRDPARVAADVRDGLVSPAAAARDYGVVVDQAGQIDMAGTARCRAAPFAAGGSE